MRCLQVGVLLLFAATILAAAAAGEAESSTPKNTPGGIDGETGLKYQYIALYTWMPNVTTENSDAIYHGEKPNPSPGVFPSNSYPSQLSFLFSFLWIWTLRGGGGEGRL